MVHSFRCAPAEVDHASCRGGQASVDREKHSRSGVGYHAGGIPAAVAQDDLQGTAASSRTRHVR